MPSFPPDFQRSRSQSSGGLGWFAGIPWLLPSLGPTLAIQTGTPLHASARMRNVAFRHVIGLAAGLLAVYLTGAAHQPAVWTW